MLSVFMPPDYLQFDLGSVMKVMGFQKLGSLLSVSIWWGVGLLPGPAALLAEVRVLSSTACIVAIVFSRAALRLESVLLSQAVDKAVKRSP